MSSDATEKIADLIIKKEGLEDLPVDVEQLASKYAKLSFHDIPEDFDGITIKERYKEPKIIINNIRNSNRKNFTIAHELGHIIIPWHVGVIIDETTSSTEFYDSDYGQLETEANKFASCILLPRDIIDKRVKNYINGSYKLPLSNFIEDISDLSNVSLLSTTFRVFKFLPPNFYFFVIGKKSSVQYRGNSRGSSSLEIFEDISLDNMYKKCSIHTDRYTFYFFEITHSHSVQQYSDDHNWEPTLKFIISEQGFSERENKRLYGSICSRFGGYYGSNLKGRGYSFDVFYNILHDRVTTFYGDIDWLIKHDDFILFFIQKVSEIYNREEV